MESSGINKVRLQKAIAQAGLTSRRGAEELIRQGRVMVNGRVVQEMGCRVDPRLDCVEVDKIPLCGPQRKIYLLFNKPRLCVTSVKDPQGRKTIFDYLPPQGVRIFPVGRLDYDAEGLLLLTNDGALANRLQHPRYGVPKTYEVKVEGHPDQEALSALRSGIRLEEGITAPAQVEILRRLKYSSWLRVIIHQGWNRQIKRMCEAVGHPVISIKRTGFGDLRLGNLPSGGYRQLRPSELRRLYRQAGFSHNWVKDK